MTSVVRRKYIPKSGNLVLCGSDTLMMVRWSEIDVEVLCFVFSFACNLCVLILRLIVGRRVVAGC